MANPFSDYGVSDADFEAEMLSEVVLRAKVVLAERAARYWRSVSPEHTGQYIDSIEVQIDGNHVSISATDEAANIIEYGNERTPEYAPRAKTQARFRNSE